MRAPNPIRSSRRRAGLTQRALAERASVTQSVVSAYEAGRREPSLTTLRRLIAAAGFELETTLVASSGGRLLDEVRRRGPELRATLGELGAVDIRLFGSVARGEANESSDVDLLVDLDDEIGLFALLRMRRAAETILGRPVDLVPAAGLKPDVAERVAREAVPL